MSHNIFEVIFKFFCVNSLLQIKSFSILYRIQRDLDLCFVKKENTGIHIMLVSQVKIQRKRCNVFEFSTYHSGSHAKLICYQLQCVYVCAHDSVCVCVMYIHKAET